MSDRDTPAGPLSADVLHALVEQSLELIAVTDGAGTIAWANARFSAATGVSGSTAIRLLDCAVEGAAGDSTRERLAAGLAAGSLEATGLRLRAADDVPLWVDARARRAGEQMLWTFTDVSSTRFLAAQARRQGEMLDTAQEFGRIGLWERRIPSGEGRWDRHVFGFWGLDPATGTPPFEEAIQRIHPDDRAKMIYAESTRSAGRYSQRYRVIQPDGKTRLIHSQWAVKNGPNGTPDRAVGIMMDDTDAYESARALVDVNAQLKLAVDLGQIAIWRHDLRTQRIHYSDRAFQILQQEPRPGGFPIEEVRSFIHPDDLPLVLASAENALASDQPTDMEARYRRADGSYRYVMTRRVVERDEHGEPLAFVGVALDVTERVEHRQPGRAAGAPPRSRLECRRHRPVDDGDRSARDRLERADLRASSTASRRPACPSLRRVAARCVHPDDRERVGQNMLAYLAEPSGRSEIEFRILRNDGGVRWVVMRADVDRRRAERRRILGVVMDVTEQHAALEALRDASERSTLIARHAGIGMWEARLDALDRALGRADVPSARPRALGPRAEPRGADGDGPSRRPAARARRAAWRRARAARRRRYEFRVRLPDGSWRWLASRSALVNDEHGRPLRRVGVNWDVTETKQAELVRQQAVLAEREIHAKSQFLSRMSHELRTPLNAVLGFTQLLQIEARRSADGGQLAKLGHIRAAGDHLLSLINDVLDLSSLESGALKLALARSTWACWSASRCRWSSRWRRSTASSSRSAEARGAARGDATRLRQVLINLLSNAIKYNRRGGRVMVHAAAAGDKAVLGSRTPAAA